MPNPARSGVWGDPWHNCDRCGVPYHLSQLAWQEGLLLCVTAPGNCFDLQTARQRDLQLTQVLDEITLYPDAQLDPKLTNPDTVMEEN